MCLTLKTNNFIIERDFSFQRQQLCYFTFKDSHFTIECEYLSLTFKGSNVAILLSKTAILLLNASTQVLRSKAAILLFTKALSVVSVVSDSSGFLSWSTEALGGSSFLQEGTYR